MARILIHSLNYRPEMTGIGRVNAEWVDWLQGRGHEVRIVCAPPYYPDWRVPGAYRGRGWWRDGAALRCPTYVPRHPTAGRRLLHLLSFALSSLPAMVGEALRWRPDLVIGVQPTLFAAPGTLAAAWLCGAASWMHVQDFEVDAAFDLGILRGRRVRQVLSAIECRLMRAFDRISAISPAMCRHAIWKGAAPGAVTLLPNWMDLSAVRVLDGPSQYRAALGIPADAIVVLYAGSMARKQGLEMVIEVARRLRWESGIHFVLCGDGAGREALEDAAAGLGNVRFLPLQGEERLTQLLGLADIHVLPQRAAAAESVLPSKLGGMLASGRPVVAAAAIGTALHDAVAGCGLCVEPEDADAMASAIRTLAAAPGLRAALGARARQRAVAEWDRNAILGRFEGEVMSLIAGARCHA